MLKDVTFGQYFPGDSVIHKMDPRMKLILDLGCVCPQCLFRCRACMGTNTVVSRENLKNLVFVDHTAEHEAQEEAGTPDRTPLRPEDFID